MNGTNLQLNERPDVLLNIDLHRANLGANRKLDASGTSVNPAAANKIPLCCYFREKLRHSPLPS